MLIILDFDDVLMNTKAFKKGYFQLFGKFGIPAQKAAAAYAAMRKSGGDNLNIHLQILKKNYPDMPEKKILAKLFSFRMRSKKYIFSDVMPFLHDARNKKWNLILVSSGNRAAQKAKIQGSGLTHFFDQIIYTKNDTKVDAVKAIVKNTEKFVFCDDKKIAVESIKKEFPFAFVVQIVRFPGQEVSKKSDARVQTLRQIQILLSL